MSPTNELCRTVAVEPWPEGGIAVDVQADPTERRALARRFDLLEVRALRGTGRLERSADGREIRLQGRLEAEVVQSCVVSLEPVPATISANVERRYGPAEATAEPVPDRWIDPSIDPSKDEEIEPLSGPRIDLGEIFAEELGLALEPYPHAPDAYALVARDLGRDVGLGATGPVDTPFAALRGLKEKRAG